MASWVPTRILILSSILSLIIVSRVQASDTDIVLRAKHRWVQGDYRGVISLLEPWSSSKSPPYGRERDAARVLLANAYQEKGDWNLAAEQYRIVKNNKRALSKYSRFQEPWVNLEAKAYWTAKKNCESIIKKYPYSEESTECLIVQAMASGELGQLRSSKMYFDRYLAKYPKTPLAEDFRLKQALYTYAKDKEEGYVLLHNLFLYHKYPTTDAQIQSLGESFTINNLNARSARINSLIRGNRLTEAWLLFKEIAEREELSKEEKNWVQENIRNFSWKTRNFDSYVEVMLDVYQKEPTGDNAWKIFRGYVRGGMWPEASEWGQKSIKIFRGRGRWAGAKDDLARVEMFAGNYVAATQLWKAQWGEAAKFYTAFCHYMAGEYEQALPLFTRIIDRKGGWDAAAAYWLGRTQQKMEMDYSDAFSLAAEKDNSGWYDLLVKENDEDINLRSGKWNLPLRYTVPEILPLENKGQQATNLYQPKIKQSQVNWLNYELPKQPFITEYEQQSFLSPLHVGDFPSGYQNTLYGTPEELEEVFNQFVQTYHSAFGNLKEIEDLVKAGLYQDSSRAMSNVYKYWEKGRNGKLSAEKNQLMRSINPSFEEWRAYFLHTHCHHYVLRYTSGMDKYFDDEELKNQSHQINYPIVQAEDIWNYAQQYNIDPYLILGLLRQESAYQEIVKSWAGAIGYIQVMPATGAKVAYMLGQSTYSPLDLEDPNINLQYGMFYFSKLMERFDNSFPFAVGSYNGGPHNMSRWYRGKMGTVDMAEFVEHIPYDETRRYIKKVTGHYNRYVQLYTDNNVVEIPLTPSFDDPKVIDF